MAAVQTEVELRDPAPTELTRDGEEIQWISLDQVMREMGKSRKTVERCVKAGVLRSYLVPRRGRRTERLYAAADVSRLLEGVVDIPRAVVVAAEQSVASPLPAVNVPPSHVQVGAPMDVERPPIPVHLKPWVTVDEACYLTCLPRSVILKWVKLDRVRVERAGAIYIKRSLLEIA